MNLKPLPITLYLNLSVALAFFSLARPESSRKVQFLKSLKKYNPFDVVYVFDKTESEEWSAYIYKVFEPVYTVNLEKKGSLFREFSIIKDNDTVLNNENLYIIYMRNFSLFEEVIDNIRHLVFWKARHRLIIITRNEAGSTDNFTELFKYCFKFWIINIAIVFIDNLEVAYTYNPFQHNYFISRNISEVFFDKTLNLHGFHINISMFSEFSNAREVNGYYHGLDGLMSRTVMGLINASYSYVVPEDGPNFGAYNETSADGILADIISERAQVGFNSRFFREKLYKVAELTYSHRRNDLVVLVPIEKEKTLRNIFIMTSPLTWVLVLGLSAFMFFYLYKFNKHLDFGAIVTIIVLVITGKPVHDLTCTKYKIFFMSSMVLIFCITAEFNCRLTSVLTISFVPPPPRTLDRLWETTRYPIKSRPSFASYLSVYVDHRMGSRLMKRAKGLERDAQIEEVMNCKKVIIICKRDIARIARKKSLIRDRNICYRTMKEIFMPNVQVYIVPYGSPLLKRFDYIIHRLWTSGIFAQWEKTPSASRKDAINKEPYKVSLDTLFVAFVVLGHGLLASTLVFIHEYRSVQDHKA